MSPESQKRLLQLYFGEEGNRYNFARLHIQSCDFGLGNRAYVEETDNFMETFSIEEDCRYQIPFIQEALKINPDISFLASPWSPPAFMKSNGEMNHGGKLLEKYYDAWAEIMVRYLLAYREKGIEIQRITVQNEPRRTTRTRPTTANMVTTMKTPQNTSSYITDSSSDRCAVH